VKTEKSGGVAGGEGEYGDDVLGLLVRDRRSSDILPVKKEAKLPASEEPGEVVGGGEEDLRCRSLLTVCQRRLGLSVLQFKRRREPDQEFTQQTQEYSF